MNKQRLPHLSQPAGRMLALWLVHWPAERARKALAESCARTSPSPAPSLPCPAASAPDPSDPVVTTLSHANARRLAGVDANAAALGLIPGMMLTEARALVPCLTAIEADEAGDTAALEALALWCRRYSPMTAPRPGDAVLIDITGVAHLFCGEEALIEAAHASGSPVEASGADAGGGIFACAVPLLAGDAYLGCLYVDGHREHIAVDSSDIELLQAVATVLAVALDRDEQLSKATQALRRALGRRGQGIKQLTRGGVFFVPPGDIYYYRGLGYEHLGERQPLGDDPLRLFATQEAEQLVHRPLVQRLRFGDLGDLHDQRGEIVFDLIRQAGHSGA